MLRELHGVPKRLPIQPASSNFGHTVRLAVVLIVCYARGHFHPHSPLPFLQLYHHSDRIALAFLHYRFNPSQQIPLLSTTMQHLFLVIAAAASYVSAQTTESSASPSQSLIGAVVPIGDKCTPKGTPCALGASCYATNSGLQTICGNFQAACTSDQQCNYQKR